MSLEKTGIPYIKYRTPQEAKDEGLAPKHRFDLIINGESIGAAEIDYYSKPLPLYQLTDLYISTKYQSKGYASEILKNVEAFLKKKKIPGVLVDGILLGDPASGMYERRGWVKAPAPYLYVYNWPSDVSLDILRGYSFRYTDYSTRGKTNLS